MFALIRRNPWAAALSILFHIALFLLFFLHEKEITFMDSAAPIESPELPGNLPVIVEESLIAERLAAAEKQRAEQQRRVIGLKRGEAADLVALRKKAEEEKQKLLEQQQQLEKLKQQQVEEEQHLAAERDKRLAEEKIMHACSSKNDPDS